MQIQCENNICMNKSNYFFHRNDIHLSICIGTYMYIGIFFMLSWLKKKTQKIQQLIELIYISLYKQEYQKYNPDQDQQIKQLAENHGRQMEYLQLRNQDLEKQRQGRHCIFLLLTFLNKLKKVCWLIFIYIYFIFVLL